MNAKIKSFIISIIVGAIVGLMLIRPLMVSVHAFDDHQPINITENIFAGESLGRTLQAIVFGISIGVFINFWLQRQRARSKNKSK